MLNNLLGFFQNAYFFTFLKGFFDILIVAILIYAVLIFIKQTHSFFILWGLLILFGIGLLSKVFDLGLTSRFFESFLPSFFIIFVIIFQKEVRHFFEWFLRSNGKSGASKIPLSSRVSRMIIDAVDDLAKKKIGALIVLAGRFRLEGYLEGGWVLGGHVSTPLLLSIFDPDSAGHDGAVIIENNLVKKFGVHLPLAENFQRFGDLGTRHRSALGLAQKTDALIIVVSEERGTISLARNGSIEQLSDIAALQRTIDNFIKEKFPAQKIPLQNIFTRNIAEKAASLALAVVFWLLFIFRSGSLNK